MARPTALHCIKILIAEHDPERTRALRADLRAARLLNRTDSVSNGLELFERLDALPPTRLPDLILLDLHMPLMDGWDAYLRLKAHPRYAHIPALLICGETEAGVAALDAIEHVTRPLNLGAMLAALTGLGDFMVQIVAPSIHPDSLW